MDLPADIWSIVKKKMLPREWANVCCTSPTTFALRTPYVVAMLRGTVANDEQPFMKQLQLDRWPSCHSLCLNLSQLEVKSDKMVLFMEEIEQACESLPMLQCLHIIDKHSESTISFILLMHYLSFLAQHASVLTLHSKAIGGCRGRGGLNLPALQHLVLDLNPDYGEYIYQNKGRRHQYLDVSRLKGLKTLYLQAPKRSRDSTGLLVTGDTPNRACVFDLTGCPHLEHVAVQGVFFEGKLALPAGCHMHAISDNFRIGEESGSYARVVTGLTLRHSHWEEYYKMNDKGICMWTHRFVYSISWRGVHMPNLKRLQLVMNDNTAFDWEHKSGQLCLFFSRHGTPSLEVIEIDVQCNLRAFIDPELTLDSLVLVAAGALQVRELSDDDTRPLCEESARITTVRQIYLQSGAALVPEYKKFLKVADSQNPGAGVRLLEHIREENSWTARMPSSFQPGDLQECCCGACPECLARAGVPILCDRAWTRDGFDKHMRPRCNAEAPSLSPVVREPENITLKTKAAPSLRHVMGEADDIPLTTKAPSSSHTMREPGDVPVETTAPSLSHTVREADPLKRIIPWQHVFLVALLVCMVM